MVALREQDKRQWKRNMQEAFQLSAEDAVGRIDGAILPEKDIDRSLATPGAAAYEALLDGAVVGGAIVVIDEDSRCNHLDFLYVKRGMQGRGIGQKIWRTIEGLYPETRIWETLTPYFDRRNIHFYINRCGFRAVEFFNSHHQDGDDSWEREHPRIDEALSGAFRFEKAMPCAKKPE